MSKKKKKPFPGKPARTSLVTHEPDEPIDWPDGHVRVELTGSEEDECIKVWVHGHTHFLHSTTARALQDKLVKALAEWNAGRAEALSVLGVDPKDIPEV
jgi:hypothetical protein